MPLQDTRFVVVGTKTVNKLKGTILVDRRKLDELIAKTDDAAKKALGELTRGASRAP